MSDDKLKELDLELRIKKLGLNDLRAALFSVKDTEILESMVKSGEDYQKLQERLKKK